MTVRWMFIIAGVLSALCANTQQTGAGISMRGSFGNEINISDVNGRSFENKYTDVTGSPYFDGNYKYATIKLARGQVFTKIQTRLNLAAQETVLITSNAAEISIPPGMVKEIVYADTTAANIQQYIFRTGFPSIDKLTVNNFYQVLSEGRCTLLKATVKSIVEKKNDLSGEVTREFETYEDYYVYTKNGMQRIKKDKAFIVAVLHDRQAEIDQFLQLNKINFRNENSLVKLFNFYNSIQ